MTIHYKSKSGIKSLDKILQEMADPDSAYSRLLANIRRVFLCQPKTEKMPLRMKDIPLDVLKAWRVDIRKNVYVAPHLKQVD